MQIAFDANTARAGARRPGRPRSRSSSTAAARRADWDDDKVEKEGTHPVVYPAAGSHATFYDSAVYVENGQRGSGLGCDNTTRAAAARGPAAGARPDPSRAPGSRFQWLTYEGRWGQQEKGFNNGPTGPDTKPQWREPFTWMDGVRSASPKLPGGSSSGPPSRPALLRRRRDGLELHQPRGADAGSARCADRSALVLLRRPRPIVLTRWRPVDLARLRQRRAFGQLIRAARQLYGRHWRTFVAIGPDRDPDRRRDRWVSRLVRLIGRATATGSVDTGDSRSRLELGIGALARVRGRRRAP